MSYWYQSSCMKPSLEYLRQAQQHQSALTKPAGSLGRLEAIAEQFCAWQASERPQLNKVVIRVFAGDHGVCAQNISAFPQAVTAQMVANFLEGGAAISVLSQQLGADFAVVNMGLSTPEPSHPDLINANIAPGTADFTQQAAMTDTELTQALDVGRQQTSTQAELFIGGEMGIGNTTSASAIYCALLDLSPEQSVGPGTGVDMAGQQRKCAAIETALALHSSELSDPYQALRHLGGLEIAALVGSYIAAAQQGTPVLVDGFISTAAALIATRLNPGVSPWLLFAHQSAEPAHRLALQAFKAQPLLDLGMRLGEGSGAAVAVPLLQSALHLHNNMATFEQAAVSAKQ